MFFIKLSFVVLLGIVVISSIKYTAFFANFFLIFDSKLFYWIFFNPCGENEWEKYLKAANQVVDR